MAMRLYALEGDLKMCSLCNIAGPLLGSFLGVLGGFYTQNLVMKKRIKLEKKEEKRRKKYILEILAKEIEHNISLLKRFHDESVQSKDFFDYNLSSTTQEAIWSELIKLESDAQFVNKLAKIYYDYKHINRKLDFQLNTTSESGHVINFRREVLRSILELKVSVTQESESILTEIREKLNLL